MTVWRALVSVPLPGVVIARRWGRSVYAYARDWSGGHDVDLSGDPPPDQSELWGWMNHLLWTCREWEVYSGCMDSKQIAKYVLDRSAATEAKRGREAAGLVDLW